MAIGHGPLYWGLILVLCVGGLLVAWNTLQWDPSTLFERPVPVPRYIFAFGDSYTTTGFDITSHEYPTLWNPLGNPDFPGATTNGGPNWVGYLVRDLAPEATLVYNFARGGATINSTLVAPLISEGRDLTYQANQFRDNLGRHPSHAPWTKDNAVVIVWMGINDVTLSLAHNLAGLDQDRATDPSLNVDIMNSYIKLMDSISITGAKNFLFLTVPPVHRSPKFQQGDNVVFETLSKEIAAFNEALKRRLLHWKAVHSKSTIRILDTPPIFNHILDNPSLYNATDKTCVDQDGKTCLWTDPFHPGFTIHQAVAQGVYKKLDEFGFWLQDFF